jgi:hypothetical protein
MGSTRINGDVRCNPPRRSPSHGLNLPLAPAIFLLRCTRLLMAQSRDRDGAGECPLSGAKRTSKFKSVTSAFDPIRTALIAVDQTRPLSVVMLYF